MLHAFDLTLKVAKYLIHIFIELKHGWVCDFIAYPSIYQFACNRTRDTRSAWKFNV